MSIRNKAGNATPLLVDPTGALLPPQPAVDAFGRQRQSSPYTIFESKLIYDNQPLLWDDAEVSGGGTSSTYNTNQASVTLAVSASTAGRRVRQTYRWHNYQSGKSQFIVMTGVLGNPATGITARIGLLNDQNGLFFQRRGANVEVVRRTYTSGTAVDNVVAQSAWNLDKLNGTGLSGITANWALGQIFVIDFQWLSLGRIRFGLDIGGTIIYCHEMLNANVLSLPYMSTPNLPLRYEIINDGTGGAASLVQICCSVISEGFYEAGYTYGLSRTTALTTLNDSDTYPLIAIRLKSAQLGATVRINDVSIACTSTAVYNWSIIRNPTVTGTAFSFTDLTNNSVQYDLSRTSSTKVSGGTVLASGTASATVQIEAVSIHSPTEQSLGSSIAGVADIFVLAVSRLTGTTETFYASMLIEDQV